MNYYKNDTSRKPVNIAAKNFNHQYDALFYEALDRWGIEVSELKKKLGK